MKRFWTFIKHSRSDGRQIPPLKTDGTLHSEPTEKVDILNGQFQKDFSEKTSISNEEFRSYSFHFLYPGQMLADFHISGTSLV
jgi:hypothetical protein